VPAVLAHNRRKRLAIHAGDQRLRAGTNSRYATVVSSEARVSHVCTEKHLSRKERSMICRKMMKVSWKRGARKSLTKRETAQQDAVTASYVGSYTPPSNSRPRVWSLAAPKTFNC
jgi:hypothetical protein